MQATYVGHLFRRWKMDDGREGEYTDIYLVKSFPLDESDGVGEKAVAERVRADIRAKMLTFTAGQRVEIVYDAGRGGKAVLSEINPVESEPVGKPGK